MAELASLHFCVWRFNLAVSVNWGSDDSEAPPVIGPPDLIGSPELDDDGLGFAPHQRRTVRTCFMAPPRAWRVDRGQGGRGAEWANVQHAGHLDSITDTATHSSGCSGSWRATDTRPPDSRSEPAGRQLGAAGWRRSIRRCYGCPAGVGPLSL